ncbi:MAG TPA: Flp family type IVb pilin [Mycobacterium sp.]|nr:Flp family type IVb pilin [Mycobacterium sp.]
MLHYIRSMQKRRNETGASAVEYGLLVALIAAVVVAAVIALGGLVNNAFEKTCDDIAGGNGSLTASC